MSEVTLDTGYLASPVADWSRERPFQIAFALSVVAHALLIAFLPGYRSVPADAPPVLQVQIVPEEVVAPPLRMRESPPTLPHKREPLTEPVPAPQPVAPQPQIVPEALRPSEPEPRVQSVEPRIQSLPEPRTVQPELPPPPRPEILALPRTEPKPQSAVPRTPPQPESKPLPKAEAVPEPPIERAPPPVARLEPRPEPQPAAPPQPRPAQLEPRRVQPEVQPPQELPRPAAPRPQAAIAPPDAQPAPPRVSEPAAPVASAPMPPAEAVKPQPVAPVVDEQAQGRLLLSFSQSISKQIKRYQKYPPPAQRRGWEGTAEVLLQVAADGNVTGISLGKSSGHAILDEEALNMVRRASPLPSAPPDLRGRALVVTVPIVFRLQNS